MIYNCDDVLKFINNDECILFDIRDDVDYLEAHIPKAVSAPDIFFYLSESTPDGLDRLKNFYTEMFSAAGLTKDKKAIIYEYSLDSQYGGSCRGYWILKYLGHENAGILHGGFHSWKKGNYPISNVPQVPVRTEFKPTINSKIIATKDDVLKAISNPEIILLDVRDEVEWIGESSSPYGIDFAPRKGKIPGAVWIEWYNFMNRPGDTPTFKSPEQIESLCAEYNIKKNSEIILYCFKGARASNTFLALTYAGFSNVKLYFASWNEWSRDFSLPIAK